MHVCYIYYGADHDINTQIVAESGACYLLRECNDNEEDQEYPFLMLRPN